jgi:hypothetical protein
MGKGATRGGVPLQSGNGTAPGEFAENPDAQAASGGVRLLVGHGFDDRDNLYQPPQVLTVCVAD